MRTEDFPTFAETFPVFCVDDEDNSMAIVVVTVPDRPDTALASKVPELQDCRWESNFTHCKRVQNVLYNSYILTDYFVPQWVQSCPAGVQVSHYKAS